MFYIREEIIGAFKSGIFPYIDGFKADEESDEELDENKFFKDIENESEDINYKLFKDYFRFVAPTVLTKTLFETKDKKENNDLVNVIKSKLLDLKYEIEKMSEDEKEIEKPNEILDIVEKIPEFNNKIQEKLGRGLKILTPSQMLSRLPITLLQLKAGNNSEKLKNEIRQLLCSLYRSKKLTKQLYKSLIDIF